jgi:hypothetical protein
MCVAKLRRKVCRHALMQVGCGYRRLQCALQSPFVQVMPPDDAAAGIDGSARCREDPEPSPGLAHLRVLDFQRESTPA